ncbi:MAG: hypothetical protein KIT54_12310 [Phycisphaeraceae bacterium]|nr:hypothetical protein [Phycisphaeraceae bacterium]
MRRWAFGLGFSTFLLVGCSADMPASFDAPDAGSRLRAVVAGARAPQMDDLRGMVQALDSDDPALRMLAIAALVRTTGERFGYDPWADTGERRLAVGRWRQWLASVGEAERPALPSNTSPEDVSIP